MKKLTGLVVILAVLILGGYYGMGVITEQTVRNNLEIVNQSNGLFADITEYKRGWFKSTASIHWRLHIPERVVKNASGQIQTEPAQDLQMQMPLNISHGPFIWSQHGMKFGLGYAQTDLDLPAKYADQFNTFFTAESTKPKMDLSLFVNYFNNSKVQMAIPEFKLTAKEGGAKFDWKGMNSTMNVTASMNNVNGDFIIDGMQFTKDQITAAVGEISSQYNLHKTDSGLYLGDATITFPSMLIKNKDQKMFELNSFTANTSSDIKDGLFNSHFKSSLNKIIANGKTYGPGHLEMALQNLDAEVLARINQQANKAQHGSDLEKQQALFAIIPELPKLFSRGAEFEISDLSFTVPEGTILGKLMISLPKGDVSNPLELMKRVQGNGKLTVPVPVLKQIIGESVKQRLMSQPSAQQPTPEPGTVAATNDTIPTVAPDINQQIKAQTEQQLNAMVESGLLVQKDANYVVEVNLNQGQVEVNGKAFNSAMMKF